MDALVGLAAFVAIIVVWRVASNLGDAAFDTATDGVARLLTAKGRATEEAVIALGVDPRELLSTLRDQGVVAPMARVTTKSGVVVTVRPTTRSGEAGVLCQWSRDVSPPHPSRSEVLGELVKQFRVIDPTAKLLV